MKCASTTSILSQNNKACNAWGRQSPARGPNPARKICRSGPRRPVSCNIMTGPHCHLWSGPWPGISDTHTKQSVTVTQWARHCNLIRYASYGYKQLAATAWDSTKWQVGHRTPSFTSGQRPACWRPIRPSVIKSRKKFADRWCNAMNELAKIVIFITLRNSLFHVECKQPTTAKMHKIFIAQKLYCACRVLSLKRQILF